MKKITLLVALMITSLGFAQNIITNGDFENGVTGWQGNAAVIGNIVNEVGGNDYISVNVAAPGNPWDTNLSYTTPMTTLGTAYKLTFEAWTTTTRTLVAGIGLYQDPWTNATQTVNLTSTKQTFVLNLVSNFANANSRIIFDMGAAAGVVNIDNVVLELTTTTCNNGVQDGDETGIDCGGSCAPCPPSPPSSGPTPPTTPSTDVVSLYSDVYTDISPINYDAGWCGANSVAETLAGTDNVFFYKGNACQGMTFPSATQNINGATNIHVDFFILAGTDIVGKVFNLKTVALNGAAVEVNIDINALNPKPVPGTWYSFDRAYDSGQLAAIAANPIIHEFGVTSNLNNMVWYDNLYLYGATLGTSKFETSSVKMYPNPVKNTLTIEANSEIQRVSVFNILGQEVMKASPKSNTATLQTNELQKGVYMVTTEIDGKVSTSKIVKE